MDGVEFGGCTERYNKELIRNTLLIYQLCKCLASTLILALRAEQMGGGLVGKKTGPGQHQSQLHFEHLGLAQIQTPPSTEIPEAALEISMNSCIS